MKLYRFRVKDDIIILIEYGDRLYKCDDIDPIDILRTYREYNRVKNISPIKLSIDKLVENMIPEYRIIKPYDPPEIWGAGITYRVSRERYSEARVAMINNKSIYEHIYDSERPELFFKDTGVRCVGHNEYICIRSDSKWTLPEPELGIVLDEDGSILGYTIVNDVTARDIEAANPLYLPQAKIYKGSCSFGPCISTLDEIKNVYNVKIELKIFRGDELLFEANVSTSRMSRKISQLIEYLSRDNVLLAGTLLMTGTGIVPGNNITLEDNDIVEITIDGIGCLRNKVIKL